MYYSIATMRHSIKYYSIQKCILTCRNHCYIQYSIEAGTSDVVLASSGQVAVPAAWVAAAARLNLCCL